MKNRSVYPYRRSGGKGRPKNAGGRNVRANKGSVQEMLTLLQPTTKALAQMLAGNTKASGQLKHARNILVRAQRFVDDRSVDRLNPGQREEYLELLARLKLTLTDAEDLVQEEDDDTEQQSVARPPIDPERLRALALSIATSSAADSEKARQPQAPEEEEEDEPFDLEAARKHIEELDKPKKAEIDENSVDANDASRNDRSRKLRLKSIRSENADPATTDAGS
jgi:hypothetical protein